MAVRELWAVLLDLLDMAERDTQITAAVDEVSAAALAYQKGEFAHAVKAGKDAGYDFLLLGASRMQTSLEALRAALRNGKPSAFARKNGSPW